MQNTNSARKVKLLVAVSPPALFQVIEHLFRGRPEFELVESRRGFRAPERQEGRELPDLIVVNVRPLRTRICRVVSAMKRYSPGSKLILICPVKGFAHPARKCGADACLEEERLVGRLLSMARELSEIDGKQTFIQKRKLI